MSTQAQEGTYYAWAPIYYDAEVNSDGSFKERKVVALGETVTKTDLNEQDFDYLASVGAIRTDKYPEEINLEGSPSQLESPQQILARRANIAMEASEQEMLQQQQPQSQQAPAPQTQQAPQPQAAPKTENPT